jgi:hypothetical protein
VPFFFSGFDEEARSNGGLRHWVLEPGALNRLSPPHTDDFPLTWEDPDDPKAIGNIRLAWGDTSERNTQAVALPVAVFPPYIHARLSVQRSCFTIHGRSPDSLLTQLRPIDPSPLVARISLPTTEGERISMLQDLRLLGMSGTTMFPDLQGLAAELGNLE